MKRYAVILGCEEYDNKNCYPDISFCHKDVELIRDTLIEYCDFAEQNVYYEFLSPYIEDKPSDILNKIEEYIKTSNEGDTILFYYAGHGQCENNEAYLILPHTDPNNLEKTALPLRDLSAKMKLNNRINVRVFDACNSGYDARGNSQQSNSNFINEVMKSSNDGWVTFASCKGNEKSYPDVSLQHGVFTYYFAKAIKEYPEEEVIYPEKLKLDICQMVSEWCDRNNILQTPTYNSSVSGNITIATRKKIIKKVDTIVNESKKLNIEERLKNIKSHKKVDCEENMKSLEEYTNYIHKTFESSKDKFMVYGNEVKVKDINTIDNVPQYRKSAIINFINNNDLKTLHHLEVEKTYEEQYIDPLREAFLGVTKNLINSREKKVKNITYKLDEPYGFPKSNINILINSDGYLKDGYINIYLCPLQTRCILFALVTIEKKSCQIDILDKIYLSMSKEDDLEGIDKFIENLIKSFNERYNKSVIQSIEYYEKEFQL